MTSSSASVSLTPSPEHRFSFGLWTIRHPGHDPFGAPTRPSIDPADFVRRLADLGAYGVQDLRFGAEDLKEALAPEGSGKSLTIGTRLARSTTETSGWTSSSWNCCWALAETAV